MSIREVEVIRVVLVDDHGLTRAGMAVLLEASGEVSVVGSTAEYEEVADLTRQCRAEVVLLSATHHPEKAISVVHALCAVPQAVALVMMCEADDPVVLRDALAAGVLGCIAPNTPIDEVVHVLREARAGRRSLPPRLAERLMDAVAGPGQGGNGQGPDPEVLSLREREVVALVARGKTNAEIGIILGVSHHTAVAHRRRAMSKLGLSNVVELVRFAAHHGLV